MGDEHGNNLAVLVVEDDPDLNEMLGAYVRIAGFRCNSAMDGGSALRLAKEPATSLVLLDIMLPDIDGLEVCRQLKNDAGTRTIPIVLLTALDRDEYRQRGRECGACAYITKPFDPERLIHTMQTLVARNGDGRRR
jgi:DNA-binding response OmpR family regulator